MQNIFRAYIKFKEVLKNHFLLRVFFVILLVTLFTIWMVYAPSGLLGKADAVGYAVCHRIGTRSFHIGDIQFSVCARCTGQYLGAVLGFLFLSIFRPYRTDRPPWYVILLLAVWASAYVIDGINSFLHLIPTAEEFWLYEPKNSYRLFTGTGVGLGISLMLFMAFNQTVWRKPKRLPILTGFYDFGTLFFTAIFMIVIILLDNPIILYPFSLISAGGILLILSLVYAMIYVMVFRKEGQYENINQLFLPLICGICVAMIQILVIDYFRFVMTGTWGGFVFN